VTVDLDRIAAEIGRSTGFDVSPRGVTPRPSPELDAALDQLTDDDLAGLQARLEGERDPMTAFVWLRGLTRIGTPAAEEAVDAYAARLRREDPWPGSFPGRRELLRYAGREEP
jgi:hypothetical protein